MRIGLLGDVMLGRAVAERIASGPPGEVWSRDLREICGACDLVIANLECCISARGERTGRVPGKPFFFRGPPASIASLDAVGVAAVSLANNHALDYEVEAMVDTLDLLHEAGIATAGAGRDADEARRAAAVEAGEARIGLVSVSDHPVEFAAGGDEAGIAYADLEDGLPEWLEAELAQARAQCDLVIAFPHWGPNMTPEPARWQRKAAAAMRESGADLVAGHSAHVFHGIEWGEGGPLLYDLGDALDDYAVNPELRNDLGVLAIWSPGDSDPELELIALALDFCHTRLAEGDEADWIATRLEHACAALGSSVERRAEHRFRVYESPVHG